MRSRVTVSTPNYDDGEIVVDAGRDKGAVEEGTFFAFLDPVDDRVLSVWRVVAVRRTISTLEMIWRASVQTKRIVHGSTLARMGIVDYRPRKKTSA
jgi:hypothetical protein